MGTHPGGLLDQALALDDLQCGQCGCGGDRVFLVGVVAIGIGAGHIEVVARDTGRNRQHATAERLAQHHDVGRRAVVLGGKEAAGLAQAGGDFVEDQQGAMRVAGLTHRLPVPRRRHVRHGAGRLGHHGGNIALAFQHVSHHGRTGQAATLQIGLALGVDRMPIGTAVAAKRCDMFRAGQEGADPAAAEQGFAANAAGAKARAMKSVPETQGLEPAGCRARQLDGDFHRVGPPGGKQHPPRRAGQARKLRRQGLGQFHRAIADEPARGKTQFIQLTVDGLQNMRVRVTHVVDVVAMEIHVAAPCGVLDPDAFGLADGIEAWRGDRLVQEGGTVTRQQRPGSLVEVGGLPRAAPRGAVDVALALAGVRRGRRGLSQGAHQMISK